MKIKAWIGFVGVLFLASCSSGPSSSTISASSNKWLSKNVDHYSVPVPIYGSVSKNNAEQDWLLQHKILIPGFVGLTIAPKYRGYVTVETGISTGNCFVAGCVVVGQYKFSHVSHTSKSFKACGRTLVKVYAVENLDLNKWANGIPVPSNILSKTRILILANESGAWPAVGETSTSGSISCMDLGL